jgi:hypothetical protein
MYLYTPIDNVTIYTLSKEVQPYSTKVRYFPKKFEYMRSSSACKADMERSNSVCLNISFDLCVMFLFSCDFV